MRGYRTAGPGVLDEPRPRRRAEVRALGLVVGMLAILLVVALTVGAAPVVGS